MQKFQKVLTPLKKEESQKSLKIAVVDIETSNWTEILAIGFYDGKNCYYFKEVKDFLAFVINKQYRSYKIYAHNGGKFDFLPLIEELSKQKIAYNITQIAGRCAQVKVYFENSTITFRDSICILPASLKKLSDAFNPIHKKLSFDFNAEIFDINNEKHKEYLKNDLLCTFEVLEKFFSSEKVRDVIPKLTIASTALAVHRTTLKRSVTRSPQEIQNFVRSGYFGGRVEIFKHEGFKLNYYDFNSIYPYIMKTCPIPVEYMGEAKDISDYGFHKITIKVPDFLNIPPLPVKFNNKLIFPTGEITGIFYSEEINLAISMGCKLIKYHYGEKFSKEFDFFREYIDFFYDLRQKNKGNAIDFISKLFLNSLYGKYGQKEEFTTLKTLKLGEKIKGQIFGNEEIFNKFGLVIETIRKRSPSMLVHIASAITSGARIHLYRCGISPFMDSIRYCDTDSLFIPEITKTSNELGSLKLEDSFDYAFFRLPKTYATLKKDDLKFKCKGFPEDFLKGISLDEFKSSNLNTSKLKVLGLRSALKRFNSSFVACELKKSIVSSYNKRKTLSDGINTRAWHLTKEGKIR